MIWLWRINHLDEKSAAPVCQGHQGWGVTSNSPLCSYLCRLLKSPDPELRIRYIIKNPFISKSVFKAQKIRQAAAKAAEKRQNSIPKSIKDDFNEKLIFAIPSLGKP